MLLLCEVGVELPLLRSDVVVEELRGMVVVGEERGVVRGERSVFRGDVCGEEDGLRDPCEEGVAPARPLGTRCADRAGADANRTMKAMRR